VKGLIYFILLYGPSISLFATPFAALEARNRAGAIKIRYVG
jgi:hypothetical protein